MKSQQRRRREFGGGNAESPSEEIHRHTMEKIAREKKELLVVIKTVRQLLRRKTPAFVHIRGAGLSTYENLQEVLLIGFDSESKTIDIFDGSEKRTLFLLQIGDSRIREIKEIKPEEILSDFKELKEFLRELKNTIRVFAQNL